MPEDNKPTFRMCNRWGDYDCCEEIDIVTGAYKVLFKNITADDVVDMKKKIKKINRIKIKILDMIEKEQRILKIEDNRLKIAQYYDNNIEHKIEGMRIVDRLIDECLNDSKKKAVNK